MAGACEQDVNEMVPEPCADMIKQYPEHAIGSKSAHFYGPGWEAAQGGIDAARLSDTITMVDFAPMPERSYEELLIQRMAPGDIHTHLYASHIPLIDENKKINDYVWAARKGVIFDTGHGGGRSGSALPSGHGAGFPRYDQHGPPYGSRMRPNATMVSTMDKYLAMGMPLNEVVYRSTQKPAEVIRRPELGQIGVGAEADVAVLKSKRASTGSSIRAARA